jgi:hypothetical protein
MGERSIKNVEQFLRLVWDMEQPSYTLVKLYRGQAEAKPLLPRLFRRPNQASRVKAIERILLKQFKNDSPYLLPSKPGNCSLRQLRSCVLH